MRQKNLYITTGVISKKLLKPLKAPLEAILPGQQLQQQQGSTETIPATVQKQKMLATVNKNIDLNLSLLHHKVQNFVGRILETIPKIGKTSDKFSSDTVSRGLKLNFSDSTRDNKTFEYKPSVFEKAIIEDEINTAFGIKGNSNANTLSWRFFLKSFCQA